MSKPAAPEEQGTSTRPYLIRALHDWCTDNGFTPYVAVFVGPSVQVPMEYVKNNEIVLNIGFEATSGLKLGNDFIEFRARFGGVARDILVPVDHVVAIYARENGQGMAFPVPTVNDGAQLRAATPAPETGRAGLRLATTGGDDEAAPEAAPPPATVGPDAADAPAEGAAAPASSASASPTPPPGGGRPALKRIK